MENNLESAKIVVLITGGNRGIGAATAKRLGELGAHVVITERRPREGRLAVNEIRRIGGFAAFIQADLNQPSR